MMICDRDGCTRRGDHRLRVMVPGWRVPEAIVLCTDHAAHVATCARVRGVVVLPGAAPPPPPILPVVVVPARRPTPRPVVDTSTRRRPGETVARAIVRVLREYGGEMTAHEIHRRTGCRKVYAHLRRLVARGSVETAGARPMWYRAAGVVVASTRRRCGARGGVAK